MLRLHPLTLFITLLPFLLPAQERILSRQFIFEKMADRSANAFLEDSYGFIWIGGSQLLRFDGHEVKPYPMREGDSTFNAGAVYALLEDSKKQIWVGSAKSLYRYDRATDQFFNCFAGQPAAEKRFKNVISLFEDPQGRIWIGDVGGLFVMDPQTGQIQYVEGMDFGVRYQEQTGVRTILEDRTGQLFAGSNTGLWRIYPDFTVEQFLPENKKSTAEHLFYIQDMALDGDTLWLGTFDGLWIFNTKTNAFAKVDVPNKKELTLNTVLRVHQDEIWMGTSNDGLIQRRDGNIQYFYSNPNNPYSLANPQIQALHFDRLNNLWVGTRTSIERINFDEQQLPLFQLEPGPKHRGNFIFRVMQDSLDSFWFRIITQGLRFSRGLEQKVESPLQLSAKGPTENIKNFCTDIDGNVWVITLKSGLYMFPKGSTKPQFIDLGDSMKMAETLNILADKREPQYIWFTTRFGLWRVDRFTHDHVCFKPQNDYPFFETNAISHLTQTDDGFIWCTVRHHSGPVVIRFDPVKRIFEAEPDNPRHPSSLGLDHINHMKAVPGNKVWLGTDDGAVIIDATNQTFIRLNSKKGEIPINVESITPDLKGNIWISGSGKICKYEGGEFHCTVAELGIENFIYSSAALGKDGRITFGGTNGLFSFYPDEVDFDRELHSPEVRLSNFKVFNKKRHLGTAYELVKEISIDYSENVISFEFSALHFLQTDIKKYRHKLEKFENDWVKTGPDERQAIYTNLSPGRYTFKVLASYGDGSWPDEGDALSITLIVKPPWYRSCLAWILYVLAAGGLIWGIRRYELRRQMIKVEARNLKELSEVKSRLYTNITHEFRTPLTIILGMADQIAKNPKEWLGEGMPLIVRNGRQLLQLVNQMLDLAKLESGSLPVKLVQGDIISYLKYLTDSFHSFAESKNSSLHFLTEKEALVMDYDPEKMLNIVSNLLSNAIKFTPAGGHIYIQVDEVFEKNAPFLKITVKDTGIGIPAGQLPHIFDRFYQVDSSETRKGEGTGIGLTLTRELVLLLNGTITVSSEVNKGSVFQVKLPIIQGTDTPKAYTDPVEMKWEVALQSQELPASPAAEEDTGQPLLLIIEDNPDVVRYLKACLESSYQILSARNGQEGIERAIEFIPDIIISDVMMPEKDGLEVCDTLKNHELTSHIPILLLTAKADIESRIAGLRKGADAYLPKPFNQEELSTQLENLVDQRKRLQHYYQKAVAEGKTEAPFPLEEHEFLQKIRALVEKHLDEVEFEIPQLAREAGMSRTQLFRKIKGLTDQSPSIFVRNVRLQKAQTLLRTTELNISEIAYEVGFNDPSFFSRAFKEVFGLSPTEVRG